MLGNRTVGASIQGIDLVRHQKQHVYRAVQEGIVFALGYGFSVLNELGIRPTVIRAGNSNMFQSEVFCETFAQVMQTELQLFDTDGAQGAARGAGVGAGIYKDMREAFHHLNHVRSYVPDSAKARDTAEAFARWKMLLAQQLEKS